MLDLGQLNPPQRAAVLHGTGPLVVFAGAGSGKTRVITYRIAHLVGQRGVAPEQILAVTFTNKAAGEMRERLASLLPGTASPWVGTFHAICARLLRRHAEAFGVSPQFVIYDDTDQRAMLVRVLRELGLDDSRQPAREMARFIERQKQILRAPADVHVGCAFDELAQRVYDRYEQRMAQCGALDFNDLLVRVVQGLRHRESLRQRIAQAWQYVLVDEFQDTNLVQLELVRLWCHVHQNLCVVGDDDQSIYKWRGADRRNILHFKRAFAAAEVIKLEQNYRSSGHILGAAMAVIGRNREREPKQLWTENPPGEKVRALLCADERDEARAITQTMRMLRDHGLRLSDMAVFYRTHAQSRVLEEEMRASNVPYRVIGGQRFYDRAEIKDVLAYLRVLLNPQDDVSLLRIINTPARGIGRTTIDRVLDLAAERGVGVWDAVQLAAADNLLAKAAAGKLAAFVSLIRGLSADAAAGLGPALLAEKLLEETGYLGALRDQDSVEADGRIENVQELVASMAEFEAEAEIPTLAQYLELVTLATSADTALPEDRLTLMTVHSAKGLEFPVVWVCGLEEGLFPLSRGSSLSTEDLEEERRLAYVAFTRAEQRLFLSHACSRRLHGDMLLGIPSRFLDEIAHEHVQRVSRVAGAGHQRERDTVVFRHDSTSARYEYDAPRGRRGPARARGGPATRASKWIGVATGERRPPAGESYVDRSDGDLQPELVQGSMVRHAKYGQGRVLNVEGGQPARVTVRFEVWGVKQIVASYLEPLMA